MIASILGTGLGLASGIYGGINSAKAAKEQSKLIDKQQAQNDAWYNRNYYQDYMDSSEARAAIKRVENTLKKRSDEARATAAVTGGTNEAVLAQQENDQELMSDTVDNLAARGDARKDNIDAINQQNQNNLTNARMKQSQMNEAGGSQLMGNGLGLIGSALSMYDYDNDKKDK